MQNVNVAKFRQRVEALENSFNCHRHACVGKRELDKWVDGVISVVVEVESLECKTAKPDDLSRRVAIVEQVKTFLKNYGVESMNNQAAQDQGQHQQQAEQKVIFDVFVTSEYEHNGEKKNRWNEVGVAFPHKDGAGFSIELVPGIAVSGQLVILQRKPKEEKKQG